MNERNKKPCIVLLPSGPHFERLFDEVLELAILRTGLLPSRLQLNAVLPLPFTSSSTKSSRPKRSSRTYRSTRMKSGLPWAVPLHSENRSALSHPQWIPTCLLGIQYLPHISYPVNAFPSDYIQLQQNVMAQLSAIMPQTICPIEPAPQVPVASRVRRARRPRSVSSDELVSYEMMALTIIDLKASAAGLSPRRAGSGDAGLRRRASHQPRHECPEAQAVHREQIRSRSATGTNSTPPKTSSSRARAKTG